MTPAESAAAFTTELAFWRTALRRYTPAQLADGASDDEWSIGQLYAHLAGSAVRFHLPMAQKALGTTEVGGELNERGHYVLSGQAVPPVKVPASAQYTPRQPADVAAIEAMLDEAEAAYATAAEQIGAAPAAAGTAAHPSMGHLTAAQWLALVPNHFRGHRRQLARLEARLGVSDSAVAAG